MLSPRLSCVLSPLFRFPPSFSCGPQSAVFHLSRFRSLDLGIPGGLRFGGQPVRHISLLHFPAIGAKMSLSQLAGQYATVPSSIARGGQAMTAPRGF